MSIWEKVEKGIWRVWVLCSTRRGPPTEGGAGFRARARIPPGHIFMFVGVWGCGVGFCFGLRVKIKDEKRKVVQVWLKNDAQIDTQICWNPFKSNPNLKESKPINNKCFLGVVGRKIIFRVSKWSQMDQHGVKSCQKAIKRKQKNNMLRKCCFQDTQPNSEQWP